MIHHPSRPAICLFVIISFVATSFQLPAFASTSATEGTGNIAQVAFVDPMPFMSRPGVMVHLSPEYTPAYLKGIVIHPEDAFKFDFIVYKGDEQLSEEQKKIEYGKLTKYFLASLAVPDTNQWVNLSPYEKDKIIRNDFGRTEMGRDLLAQDYMLKQITASLIYPEDNLGKKFWNTVYSQAQAQFGDAPIPMINTFNKVWILPDDAVIYEKGNTAYVLRNHLRVMLEEDYLALKNHEGIQSAPTKITTHTLASKIIKQIVLPELEREVNEDKNFATLRQVYSGMLLATWYKQALKRSILGMLYANKSKVRGVDQDPRTNNMIYMQYLRAYKRGVFNYIKEDVDKYTNEVIPRKYFSGGTGTYEMATATFHHNPITFEHAMNSNQIETETPLVSDEDVFGIQTVNATAAMSNQMAALSTAAVLSTQTPAMNVVDLQSAMKKAFKGRTITVNVGQTDPTTGIFDMELRTGTGNLTPAYVDSKLRQANFQRTNNIGRVLYFHPGNGRMVVRVMTREALRAGAMTADERDMQRVLGKSLAGTNSTIHNIGDEWFVRFVPAASRNSSAPTMDDVMHQLSAKLGPRVQVQSHTTLTNQSSARNNVAFVLRFSLPHADFLKAAVPPQPNNSLLYTVYKKLSSQYAARVKRETGNNINPRMMALANDIIRASAGDLKLFLSFEQIVAGPPARGYLPVSPRVAQRKANVLYKRLKGVTDEREKRILIQFLNLRDQSFAVLATTPDEREARTLALADKNIKIVGSSSGSEYNLPGARVTWVDLSEYLARGTVRRLLNVGLAPLRKLFQAESTLDRLSQHEYVLNQEGEMVRLGDLVSSLKTTPHRIVGFVDFVDQYRGDSEARGRQTLAELRQNPELNEAYNYLITHNYKNDNEEGISAITHELQNVQRLIGRGLTLDEQKAEAREFVVSNYGENFRGYHLTNTNNILNLLASRRGEITAEHSTLEDYAANMLQRLAHEGPVVHGNYGLIQLEAKPGDQVDHIVQQFKTRLSHYLETQHLLGHRLAGYDNNQVRDIYRQRGWSYIDPRGANIDEVAQHLVDMQKKYGGEAGSEYQGVEIVATGVETALEIANSWHNAKNKSVEQLPSNDNALHLNYLAGVVNAENAPTFTDKFAAFRSELNQVGVTMKPVRRLSAATPTIEAMDIDNGRVVKLTSPARVYAIPGNVTGSTRPLYIFARNGLPRINRGNPSGLSRPITDLKKGGIDLNSANLNLLIKRDGNGIVLPLSQQNLAGIHIDGLIPVVLYIKPALSSPVMNELQLTQNI